MTLFEAEAASRPKPPDRAIEAGHDPAAEGGQEAISGAQTPEGLMPVAVANSWAAFCHADSSSAASGSDARPSKHRRRTGSVAALQVTLYLPGMVQTGMTDLRVSELPLIGRDNEIAVAVRQIERVIDGFGHAIAITGPSGIGKTRLVEEIVQLAEDRGCQVMRASSHPADRGLAYGPILRAVGRIVRSIEAPERAEVLRGLESVGLILEGLGLRAPPALGDPVLEKTRLFESMLRLIDRLAERHPVVMLIEDVQWLDEASVELISYLTSDLSSMRVLLALTCSSGRIADAPADPLLDELHTRDATEMALQPLDAAEIGRLAEAALGGPVRATDRERLASIAAGMPLLLLACLDEMSRSGGLMQAEGRWGVVGEVDAIAPKVADDVFLAQVSRLHQRDRAVLEVVAVGGDELSHEQLRSVAGLGEDELIDSIRSLTRSGLLIHEDRVDDIVYKCGHPLIAQVVYEHAVAASRNRLHASFIRSLEADPAGSGPRLAWHYERAGFVADRERRLSVLRESGERALQSYANGMAIELLGSALGVARSAGPSAAVPTLLEELGEALQRIGEERGALERWSEAENLIDDPVVRARLYSRMAAAESNLGHFERARDHVVAGIGALSETDQSELVELNVVGALNSFRQGDITSAATGVERVSVLADDLRSPRLQVYASSLQAGLALERASYHDARTHAGRALEIVTTVDDPVAQQQALAFLGLVDVSLGDLAGLDSHLRADRELTERMGVAARAYRFLLYQFTCDLYAGRWDEAEDVTVEAAFLAPRLESSRNQVVLVAMPAILDILRGDLQRAEYRLARARRFLAELDDAEPRLGIMLQILDAWSDLEVGRPGQALAALEDLEGDYLLGLLPPWGMMLIGEAQARVGDERYGATADRLSRLGPARSLPSVWALRIEAWAQGDTAGAADAWASAAAGFDALGMPFEMARATLSQAELSSRAGHVSAVTLAADCHSIFARLGAMAYRDRSARLIRSLGASPPPADPAARGSLSRRQREVAELVAEGLTNTAIAERLYISRRTVTTHLENIYRQLGIRSRTALTRHVMEDGVDHRYRSRNT